MCLSLGKFHDQLDRLNKSNDYWQFVSFDSIWLLIEFMLRHSQNTFISITDIKVEIINGQPQKRFPYAPPRPATPSFHLPQSQRHGYQFTPFPNCSAGHDGHINLVGHFPSWVFQEDCAGGSELVSLSRLVPRLAGGGVMHMSILNALPASMTLAPLNDVNNGRHRLVSIYPDAAHVDTHPLWPPQR